MIKRILSIPFVKVVEVGARDGLQNKRPLSISDRISFINRLTKCNFPHIEVGSMVKLDSMKYSDDVYDQIEKNNNIEYSLLALNLRGLDNCLRVKPNTVSVVVSPSETFSAKNMGKPLDVVKRNITDIIQKAKHHNIQVRGYISTIAHCPYEGEIDIQKTTDLANFLYNSGCYEISLGDTLGNTNPIEISKLLDSIKTTVPVEVLAGHYHNTYGMALANVMVSLDSGVRIFDSSVGGLGGCPFAPGAAGNLSTEDLVYMLNGLGMETGIDYDKVKEIGKSINKMLN